MIVLEARDRVGGRALNRPIGDGEISERGATFVGPTQNRIMALASEFGVGKFPTFDNGDNVYVDFHGKRSTYSDTGPFGSAPPDPAIAADLAHVVLTLDQMSTEVPVSAPWTAPKAAEWDGQTLAKWVADNSSNSPAFRALIPLATRRDLRRRAARAVALVHALLHRRLRRRRSIPAPSSATSTPAWARRCGAFTAERRRLRSRSPRRSASGSSSTRRSRGSPRQGSQVTVHARGLEVSAQQVIVAIPPTLAGRIDYTPALPAKRTQLTNHLPQGTLMKATAVYDTPFWRAAGLNGSAVSYTGPANVTFDDSPPDASKGVIFGFIGGDEARAHRKKSTAQRRAAVLANYTKYFGPKAAHPREYFETDWSQMIWTRGCPVAIAGPGTLTKYGPALREPVGRIHWAGTETSGFWNGYMDGAVRSGERAAEEALAQV